MAATLLVASVIFSLVGFTSQHDRIRLSMDCTKDCNKIYNACKGASANEKDIIDVIGRRTLKERHELRLRYAELYREDLVDVLNSKLSGDFRQLAKYLFFGPIQVLALQLYKFLKTEGTADTALIDIICCCSPTDLSALQKIYKKVLEVKKENDTSRTLANDVEKKTNGTLREYMRLFLNTERKAFSFAQLQTAVTTADWDVLVNFQEAENKAERIFSALNTSKKNTDESTVIEIIAQANMLEIRVMYDYFMEKYEESIVDFISKHVKTPLRNALNTTIMTAVNIRMLLVAQLYNSLHGLKLNTPTISRIFILRSDMDLKTLRSIFDQKLETSLVDMIREETSGAYQELLLALLTKDQSVPQ